MDGRAEDGKTWLASGVRRVAGCCGLLESKHQLLSPAAAGTSSVAGAGTGDEGGAEAASGAAGAADPDAGGSSATNGGSAAGGKPSTDGGVGGESGKTMHGSAGGGSGSVAAAGSGGTAGTAGVSSGGAAGSAGVSAAGGSTAGNTGVAGASADPVVQLDGNASASSSENDSSPGGGVHPARLANDGDPKTRWCAAAQTLPQWWQLDLGTSHALSRVEIVWEYPAQASGHAYGYTIGVSENAAQFPNPPLIDKSANQSTAKTQIASFAPQTAGRYLRITVTSLPPDTNDVPPLQTWASINEVRVFGH